MTCLEPQGLASVIPTAPHVDIEIYHAGFCLTVGPHPSCQRPGASTSHNSAGGSARTWDTGREKKGSGQLRPRAGGKAQRCCLHRVVCQFSCKFIFDRD